MVMFELFPWHSTAVTGPIRPPAWVIDEFLWQPITELGVDHVFAFGRPWEGVAKELGLHCVGVLGLGGEHYGSSVPSRAVRVYKLPGGEQRLVVEWHSGSAGPPNAAEVELLRDALVLSDRDSADTGIRPALSVERQPRRGLAGGPLRSAH
jgi:hypothetical protein